jgi:hypothetical protein
MATRTSAISPGTLIQIGIAESDLRLAMRRPVLQLRVAMALHSDGL